MAFVAPKTTSNRVEQPALDIGSFPGRLVKIASYGKQTQIDYATKKEKNPVDEISLTFELVDAFMVDAEGNDVEDKPRWVSITMPFYSVESELAKSTKFYKAFDPELKDKGDWEKQLGKPVTVNIGAAVSKTSGKPYNKVLGVVKMRDKEAAKTEELKNPPIIFNFYDPDKEVFDKMPKWEQEKIQKALNYAGSDTQAVLEGEAPPKKAPEPEQEPEEQDEGSFDDMPWDE